MAIEVAGILAGWLWQKLADAAYVKDKDKKVKDSLTQAVSRAYERFVELYATSAAPFFDENFIEKNLGPELIKLLTRSDEPNISLIVSAYESQFTIKLNVDIEKIISDFIGFVEEELKKEDALQNILNSRQIDETNQIVKNVEEKIDRVSDIFEEKVNLYTEDQIKKRQFESKVLQDNALQQQQLTYLIEQFDRQELSQHDGVQVNALVSKQLDLVKDDIEKGNYREAKNLLMSLEESLYSLDNFYNFRWHTCNAACFLANEKEERAAEEYLKAYDFAPEEEKALLNRARAFLLQKKYEEGLVACEEGLIKHPNSALLWSMKMSARMLLGQSEPDVGLPESLYDEKEILYALSHVRQQQNRLKEAYDFALSCFEKDRNQIESKRTLLTSAVIWATEDSVSVHMGQISQVKITALNTAIKSLEPLEESIEKIQQQKVSLEIINNVAIALNILGDVERVNYIVQRGLYKHPLAEGLLRIRINELRDQCDYKNIREITDPYLKRLTNNILIMLAEISTNNSDDVWFNEIHELLKSRELKPKEFMTVCSLFIHMLWMTGRRDEAVEKAKKEFDQDKSNVLVSVLLTRMLNKLSKENESEYYMQQCIERARDSSSSDDTLQVADLLFDFEKYSDAAIFYRKLLGTVGEDLLTQRYLMCLIGSDQRGKAHEIVEMLPDETRDLPPFRRIEASLARAAGDWTKLRDILSVEIERDPEDSSSAVGYVGALYRLQEKESLNSYLSSDPIFKNTCPENEFEFAKYQAKYGYKYKAINRLYRLFRNNPHDSNVAGYFLTVLLLTQDLELPVPQLVTPGVAVYIHTDTDEYIFVIDNEDGQLSWPEIIQENSKNAKNLIGRKVGDKVELLIGIGSVVCEIKRLESIIRFAADKAHEIIKKTAVSSGPLTSVSVVTHDGDYDFDPILQSLRERSKHVDRVFSYYNKQPIPISILADALGTDTVTLLLEWPFEKNRLFVCQGTHEERNQAISLFNKERFRYVLDLTMLVELVRMNLFEKTVNTLGVPLVPESIKEQLLVLIQGVDDPRASSMMSEVNGSFNIVDIPSEYFIKRKLFLESMLNYVNDFCEVLPTYGPSDVSSGHLALTNALDRPSLDSVYLALEHNAYLITEDGALRTLAGAAGVVGLLWLQPLLAKLRDDEVINDSEYSRIFLEKLSLNHSFTSISSNDLLWAAKNEPAALSPLVVSALETFRSTTVEINSAVTVCGTFLVSLLKKQKPDIVKQYYEKCVSVLTENSPEYSQNIINVLTYSLTEEIELLHGKKRKEVDKKARKVSKTNESSTN